MLNDLHNKRVNLKRDSKTDHLWVYVVYKVIITFIQMLFDKSIKRRYVK